jgi:hypothetical protein
MVMAIASQPFWLHWHDGKRRRRHAPDYFVRLADGRGQVVDVRAGARIGRTDAEAFSDQLSPGPEATSVLRPFVRWPDFCGTARASTTLAS